MSSPAHPQCGQPIGITLSQTDLARDLCEHLPFSGCFWFFPLSNDLSSSLLKHLYIGGGSNCLLHRRYQARLQKSSCQSTLWALPVHWGFSHSREPSGCRPPNGRVVPRQMKLFMPCFLASSAEVANVLLGCRWVLGQSLVFCTPRELLWSPNRNHPSPASFELHLPGVPRSSLHQLWAVPHHQASNTTALYGGAA